MERKNKKYDDITSPIYTTLHREYEAIIERGRSIDSRAGIFLTFLFTSFPFYVQIIDVSYLFNLLRQTCFSFSDVLLFIVFVLSTITFLICFILFVKTLSTRKYKVFNNLYFKGFDLIKYEDNDTTINDINVSMMSLLHEYIEHNEIVVTKKAKLFDASLWLCFAFTTLMIITIFLKLI